MSAPIAIFPIIVIFLVLVGLIIGITLWITGGRSRGKGEMACGRCGYAVRGLEALNCPECGADLRVVGIQRTKGTMTRNVGIALTLGTALLLLTCMGSMFMWMDAPSSIQSSPSSLQAVPSNIPNPSINQPSNSQTLQSSPPAIEVQDPEAGNDETDR